MDFKEKWKFKSNFRSIAYGRKITSENHKFIKYTVKK